MKLDYEFGNSLSPILSVRCPGEYRKGKNILFGEKWNRTASELTLRYNIHKWALYGLVKRERELVPQTKETARRNGCLAELAKERLTEWAAGIFIFVMSARLFCVTLCCHRFSFLCLWKNPADPLNTTRCFKKKKRKFARARCIVCMHAACYAG